VGEWIASYKVQVCDICRTALEKAGILAKDFAGHSFRIGAATTAAISGLEDLTIQTLKSTAFKLYVRLDPHYLASLAPTMAVYQF